MDYKKINKKGASTLSGLVVSLLLVIGIFSGMFLFFNQQAQQNDMTLDSKYNDTYQRLLSSQSTIDDNVNEIQTNLADIKEADNTFQVAWNGLKGLGNVLTLPVSFISSGVETFDAVAISGDVLPPQQTTLIRIGIVAVIVLLILAILSGGNPKI